MRFLRGGSVAAAAALMLIGGPASAAEITFQQAPAGALSTYTESGFAVSAVSGPWVVSDSFGNPAPFVQFINGGQSALTGSIQITSGGSPFTFGSVDLYSSVTPIPYVITGFLNAAPVFSLEGTIPNTFGAFRTLTGPGAGQVIDALSITLTNPEQLPGLSNPVGLDNIVVTPASVSVIPEPGTLALLGAGLLPMAGAAIRRRRNA